MFYMFLQDLENHKFLKCKRNRLWFLEIFLKKMKVLIHIQEVNLMNDQNKVKGVKNLSQIKILLSDG